MGQGFIRRLVDARFKDEAALIGIVEAYMEEFHQAAASMTRAAPMDRVWRPFALAYATGRLAKKWKLIPADWGSFKKATLNAYRIASECMEGKRKSSRSIDPLDSLTRYLGVSKLVDVRKSELAR